MSEVANSAMESVSKSGESNYLSTVKILAISGSLRSGSSNTALLRAMAALAPANVEIQVYEGVADLPHFSPEIDDEASPSAVVDLRAQLHAADAVILCTPEYIHGMPGSLKNLLDWTASSGDFVDKPVAALSASPSYAGGEKAHASLVSTLKVLSAKVVEEASLIVPAIRKKVNANGEITDPQLEQELRSVLAALERVL